MDIASVVHASAQGAKGARGSGADIAAAVHGGAIAFTRPDRVERVSWPAGVELIPFFTGVSADTATLVARVQVARERDGVAVAAALAAIDRASRAAIQACTLRAADLAASALLAGLQLAAVAVDQLAAATGVELVPDCVRAARASLTRLGGTAKTTGAGGGDIGIAVIPATEDATTARRYLIESGCQPLAISVDTTGVDLQPNAQ
jgi:mevalonate kinase